MTQKRTGTFRPKQTHDASPVDMLLRFPFDVPGIYRVRLVLNAISQDGLASRVWEILAAVRIERRGSPFVVGEPVAVLNEGGGSDSWEADFVVNNSSALALRVTGAASTTIAWTATYEVTP